MDNDTSTFVVNATTQQPQQRRQWLKMPSSSSSSSINIELYVVVAFLIFLSVIGTAGNSLVIWVYRQKRDKLVSTVFILVLAVVDLTTCLVIIPFTVYMEVRQFHVGVDAVCKTYQFLITSNIPFSALIMVAIAVDRYFCICHPFRRVLTVCRAKATAACLGLVAAGLGVCVSLMYSVYGEVRYPFHVHDNVFKTTWTEVNATDDGVDNNDDAFTIGRFWPEYHPTTSSTLTGSAATVAGTAAAAFDARSNLPRRLSGVGGARPKGVLKNLQFCGPSDRILSEAFLWYYQKVYNAGYLVCLAIVVVLYVLIYRSVLARRSRRQKQLSKSLSLVASIVTSRHHTMSPISATAAAGYPDAAAGGGAPSPHRRCKPAVVVDASNGPEITVVQEIALTTIERVRDETIYADNRTSVDDKRTSVGDGSDDGADVDHEEIQQKLSMTTTTATTTTTSSRDRNRMANLKTAAMLFVVTVVFIVTLLPALLMTVAVIPHVSIVFYFYFANNVANPFIYSFMNKNFRDDLRRLFCRQGAFRKAARLWQV